ncbi:MAG: PAS domain-containing protein [Oscillibacter sp.]|jgi:PAS domain S-box-containing protein|nr:PAS domain-containing protein [Oscillibacter sp.]
MDQSEGLKQLKKLLNQAPCGIGLFETESAYPAFLNDEYFRIVGYTREEYQRVMVDGMKALVIPSDRKTAAQSGLQFEKDGVARNYEYRITRKDGSIAWVKLNLSKIMLWDREYVFASFSDITSEKESYLKINMIAENVASSVSLFQVTNGVEKLVYANEQFYQTLGIQKEQYSQNAHLLDKLLVSQKDLVKIQKAVYEAIQTGKPGIVEHQLLRPDGKIRWVSRRYAAIKQDTPGNYFLASAVTDITKEKNAELAELLERQRYQMVIDELNGAVFEWNFKTGEFFKSTAYKRYALSQISNDDILHNRGNGDTVHPDDLPVLKRFFADTKSGKPRAEATLRLKMVDGSYRWCRMMGFYLKDKDGKPNRTIGMLLDINADRERELMMNSLLNGLPGGVAIFKVTDRLNCEYFSDGFAKISGRTREEVNELNRRDQLIENVIAPIDRKGFAEALRKCLSNEQINMVFRFTSKDGTANWVQLAATKIREEADAPVYYCVFTTPSRETALYRSVVEDSANGILIAERATRRIIYMNDALHRIYGIPADVVTAEARVSELRLNDNLLLPQEQINALRTDRYAEFHITYQNRLYLSIRAKALDWNGADAYILYVADESREHERQIQLQNLVDHIPGGIGIFDLYDGKAHRVYLNDSFYELLSDKRENHVHEKNTAFFDNIHPDDRPSFKDAVSLLSGGTEKASLNYRMKKKDGSYIWLHLNAEVSERRENVTTIYCSFMDFQETKQIQEKLETANAAMHQQYQAELARRKLLEKNSSATVVSNLSKGYVMEIHYADGTFVAVSKKTPYQEVIELVLKRIPNENDRHRFTAFMDARHLLACFHSGKNENVLEYQSIQRGGELHWIRAISNLAKNPETGDVISYGYYYDIDREKSNQLAIDSAMDKEIDFVMLVNAKTGMMRFAGVKMALANVELREEYPLDSVTHLEKICSVGDYQTATQFFQIDHLNKILRSGGSAGITIWVMTPAGERQRKTVRAYYLDESREKIVVICKDITDLYWEEQQQKQALQAAADEAIRANRAKSDFLSRMSHDMRTPLNGMLGLACLMKGYAQDDAIQRDLSQMEISGQYLLNLINDTLDVSRIESGKLELHPSVCAGEAIFNNIISLGKATLEAKHIHLEIRTDGLHGLMLYVDVGRVEQIVMNILGNAAKFTPEGGHVTCSLTNLAMQDGAVTDQICIQDDGIGMSSEYLPHIFEPFSQADSSRKNTTQGTGLGMNITKQLVELMGGTITVESKLGKGTRVTFTLVLPIATKEQIETWQRSHKKAPELGLLAGKRVLLCEDHPLNATIAARLLNEKGVTVDHAENGQQGLEMFRRASTGYYDAVLMDIRMPVMDGLETAESIRRLPRRDAKSVPIIAMTANALSEDVEATQKAGMNAHLAKPIEPHRLYETLEYFFHEKQTASPHD